MANTVYSILGIGAPLLDHILPVSDEALSKVSGSKGGMELVSPEQFNQIIQDANQKSIPIPSGCTTNIIKGLAQMGHCCKFLGKAAIDNASHIFRNYFQSIGVTTVLIPSKTPTGQAACLVTPDGERTIRTCIGACNSIS